MDSQKTTAEFMGKNARRSVLRLYKGLLRSRMKRVMDYVNGLIISEMVYETADGRIEIHNLESRRMEFKKSDEELFREGI